MKISLKWPLFIALVAIVLRIALEQAGAPSWLSNLSSVVMLYVLICPLYFAWTIAAAGSPKPYATHFKTTVLYAFLARLMVVPTYWLAYIFQWPAARFSVEQGGVVGPDMTAFRAFVQVPVVALIAWVVFAAILGGGLGSLLIRLKWRPA